ncbi:DNA topoisomerase VI subunit B [Candidatus Bathyarchaeota archaeon]|nr:DNA topoisomerase VI subunit B [Candidatus Bathyarchaeota archaeon]MBS7630988.1 DNA topoisomerase VI subunit B [Candidatus Bathyarchaeota archaeon]
MTKPEVEITYQSISPSDFFYRNREIAGFSNPSRAIYAAVRELLENSLDACESISIPPKIYLRITEITPSDAERESAVYVLRIEDNGTGIPSEHIPRCFGQVFYGSKYNLKQARGTFGLGGTITVLYGQITTHKPVKVVSSTGVEIHEYEMMIDIEYNRPMILRHTVLENKKGWRGTIVELHLEGDYTRSMSKLYEYLKQTAMVCPYADITFVDPKGRLYRFESATNVMPKPPKTVRPHPHGIDVETLRRMTATSKVKNMKLFMIEQFQGVGVMTAEKFLNFAGIDPKTDPKSLSPDDVVKLVRAAKEFKEFLRPDASCLSPLGEELLSTGIRKELNLTEKDFLRVYQRHPSTYSGFPFIVEAAIALGRSLSKNEEGSKMIYRFANRIPLLFDESSCVVWKVVNKNINWSTYKVSNDTPLVIAVHLCSTKIPYKSVGKEFLADQPEVEKEITNALRHIARYLRLYISRNIRLAKEKRRLNVFEKFLPKIAEFSAKLADKPEPPDIKPLLNAVGAELPEVERKIREVPQIAGEND